MGSIETDVLIVGSGPAGLSAALALSTYGVRATIVTKRRWLAHTPRAHVTNQRTFEVLRDLGIEDQAMAKATPYEEMPSIVFCRSLPGEEYARIRLAGAESSPERDYRLASPCVRADLAQNLLEPILLDNALSRGANVRFNTEYRSSMQDDDGVTATVRDVVSSDVYDIRARYMIGADGGRSRVVADLQLPTVGEMDIGGSYNILFECDLSAYVAYRPAMLYFIIRDGTGTDGVGLGILRAIGPNRWLLARGYALGGQRAALSDTEAVDVVRDYLGDDTLPVVIRALDPWNLNSLYVTRYGRGRIFCVGDAVHRHAPSNGLGSNTGIQDSYNLAWKLALVLSGTAHPALLESFSDERAPVGRSVVERATEGLVTYAPVLETLGLLGAEPPERGVANLAELKAATPEGARRREAFFRAVAEKKNEFQGRGIELNHQYRSSAVVGDASAPRSYAHDERRYYSPTTCPGSRLPHAWVQRDGRSLSTLDLVGRGRFTMLTGIGGDAWSRAADAASRRFGLPIATHAIGFGCAVTDLYGEWADLREIDESGCLLVRPDGYVAWRAFAAPRTDERARRDVRLVFEKILGRASVSVLASTTARGDALGRSDAPE